MSQTPLHATLARIAARVLTVVACLLIVGAVAFVAVPRLFHWQGVIVLSGSMEPVLKTGGFVFIDRDVDPNRLTTGDVITFRDAGNNQITHRIIAVSDGREGVRYETKGDANGQADQAVVAPQAVVGKMVFALPYAGHWANWLQQQNNFQLLIWPIVGLILISELWNIAGQMRQRRRAAEPAPVPARPARSEPMTRLAPHAPDAGRSEN